MTVMFAARKRLGMTQAEVAHELGVTQPRVSLWERGVQPVPERHRQTLAKLLGVHPDRLTDVISFS